MSQKNCQPRSRNLTSVKGGKSVFSKKTPVKFSLRGQVEIKQITQKQIWESFLLQCDEKTFLDSWNWGEFQKKMGNKIWRLGIYENENLLSVVLVIKITAKRGSFLFLPHSPIVKNNGEQFSSNFGGELFSVSLSILRELKKIARQENCSFIRIAPIWERNDENIKIFKDLGFRQAPIHMHPELTWKLDIKPDEDQLLMDMRKTTRYLIRQAQKNKDIEIIQSNNIQDIEKFDKLYQTTVNRQGFAPFSLNYLKNEFSVFQPDNQISIFLGRYKNEIVSSAIIIFWQGIGFYHQGASSLKYPKIPVSYLLQWEAIREAKRRGCRLYNFWGIAPDNNKKHPWYGLTLFKMGFGGYKKEYVKTQDFVLSPKYWITYIIETIRKKKRGL